MREKSLCNHRSSAPSDDARHAIQRDRTQNAHGSIWQRNREGKLGLTNGKLENMIETATRVAGLTRKQYKEWREIENWKRREEGEWKGKKSVEEKEKKK